jgi:uncharacterized protein YqjF (DUF2071 family)
VLRALKRHPFGIEAFFRSSLVLTYAVPQAILADLVDPGLELDTYDAWGFLAIAMVETLSLRPRGFPRWLGRDFFLIGYRIFTRFVRPGQPTLRGLRILRSDTDRRSMVRLGNLFTRYNYRLAKVRISTEVGRREIRVQTPGAEADLHVVADLASRPAALPKTSPFRTMEDARSFAGPLPFTFSYDAELQKMVVIKGVRSAWDPEPIHVEVHEASYLKQPRFASEGVRLANAFYLESTPYRWKAGTLEAPA